jgi:hypothetical protein
MMNEQKNTLNQYMSDLLVLILFSGIVFFTLIPKNQPNCSYQFLKSCFAHYSAPVVKNYCFTISKTTQKPQKDKPETFINFKIEKYFYPFSGQVITQDFLPERELQNPLLYFLVSLFLSPEIFFKVSLPNPTCFPLAHYQHFSIYPNEGWQIFAYLNAIPTLV